MGQDRTKVAIDHYWEVAYALSIGTKISDTGWPWTAITHSIAQNMMIWMKINQHYQIGGEDVSQRLEFLAI